MTDLCSRCGGELDFDPSSNEVYDYVDALCEECVRNLCCDDEDGADHWLGMSDSAYTEFMSMVEMDFE